MDLFPGARLKRAEVMQRRTQVVELASAGWDYDQIAVELGYANRSGAWKAHQRALATQQAETVEEHLALEVARLDALQDALWDKAMAGHVRSIREIRQIIMQRSRLLQLDSGKPGRKPEGPTSVVLPSFWAAHDRAPPGELAGVPVPGDRGGERQRGRVQVAGVAVCSTAG